MRKLSIGTQTFAKIIEDNCIYVDKTRYIYDLIQGYGYFLARPRRFGKSLLCSTLKDLFLGKKELFKDLWIDKNTDYRWPVHPVIHIDLSQVVSNDPEQVIAILMRNLDDIAELYDLDRLEHTTPGEMLKKLTMRLYKKFGSSNRVVIIIDEYDKPILDNVDKKEVAHEVRRILRTFYEFIKSLDEYLRFVFITGITRISKTSIFSGMNQFPNISMSAQYSHIVGYTKSEIDFYFQEHFYQLAQDKKLPLELGVDKLKSKLHAWYNGYRFWKDEALLTREIAGHDLERLYSPFSILSFLSNAGDFSNYWFESGTP